MRGGEVGVDVVVCSKMYRDIEIHGSQKRLDILELAALRASHTANVPMLDFNTKLEVH